MPRRSLLYASKTRLFGTFTNAISGVSIPAPGDDRRRWHPRLSQLLRIFFKGGLRLGRMSRVVVTLKAGARLSLAAKVRGLALELKARASGPRTGAASRVPVPAEAQGRGVLPGDQAELPDGNRPRARACASSLRRRRRNSRGRARPGSQRARCRVAMGAPGRRRRPATTRGREQRRLRRRRSREASRQRRPRG